MLNLDSYIGAFSQNYYLYLDSLGGFHPVIWDLNLAFGGFRLMNGNKRLNNEEMRNLHLFVHYKESNEKRPLVTKLLANNLYRKMYLAHCRTIYRDYLENGLYLQRAKEWQAFIAPHLKQDKYKLIVERDCYVHVFEAIFERAKSRLANGWGTTMHVSGNPGIGKSRFYLYFIFRLISYEYQRTSSSEL
jgi:spore coat protein CotH